MKNIQNTAAMHTSNSQKTHDDVGSKTKGVAQIHQATADAADPLTHRIIDLRVGAGAQQQPRAVRATLRSSTNQRRLSVLNGRVWPM